MRRLTTSVFVLFVLLSSFGALIADSKPQPVLTASHQSLHADHDHGAVPMSDNVSYNENSKKYHNSTCRYWGCANCITISKADAKKRGGVACKVCGG